MALPSHLSFFVKQRVKNIKIILWRSREETPNVSHLSKPLAIYVYAHTHIYIHENKLSALRVMNKES